MKHTFRKCLSLVLALATLLSVCVVPLTAATECNHYNYGYTEIGYQDPTCTEYGGLLVVCDECNERYVRRETWVDPLGHDWVKDEDTYVAPTLTTDGGYYADCSRCDDRKWFDLKATKCEGGCDPKNLKVENTATCTEAGEKITTCQVCGLETKEPAPALGHAWNNGVITVRPVCGEQNGEVKFTCTREGCDDTYTVEKIAPADHEWKWFEEDLGSCGVNGNTAGYKCMQEGCTGAKDGYSVIVNNPHNYQPYAGDEERVNVAVGCAPGNQWYKCQNSNCLPENKYKNEQLTPTEHGNHQIKKVYVGKDPVTGDDVYQNFISSCLTKVSEHTCFLPAIYSCALCGAAINSPLAEDAPSHNFAHEVESTCTTFGYKVCIACGGTEGYADLNGNPIPGNEKYNKKGHLKPADETQITKVPATCFEGAYILYWCQRDCCKTATEQVKEYTSEANPHDTVTVPAVAPTCTTTGVKGGTYCKNCNTVGVKTKAAAEEVIAVLGHTWSDNDATNDKRGWVVANCMYAAHEGELCGRCSLENLDPTKMDFTKNPNGKIDENGHDWENADDSLLTEPTCTQPGSQRMYCRICNQEHIAEISALKHDWQNDPTIKPVGVVPATCYGDGYYVYYCSVCQVTAKGGETIKLAQTGYDRFDTHYLFPSLSKQTNPATGTAYTYADDYDYIWDNATQSYKFVLTPLSHDAITDLTTGATRTENRVVGLDDPNTPYIDGYNAAQNKGSCGVRSYYEWTCEHCKYTYNKMIEDQFGECGSHAGAVNDIAMNCVTGTPGTEGRVVCERCTQVLNAGSEVPVWHDIDDDADTTIGLTAATCLKDGWTEYGVCAKCTAAYANSVTLVGKYELDGNDVYRWNGFVAYLGHKVGVAVEAQKVTCELPGWDAHIKCVRCAYVVDNATIDKNAPTAAEGFANVTWVAEMTAANGVNGYKDKTGHNFTKNPMLVPMQCKKDGYVWYDCCNENCSAVDVQLFKFGYYEHRYSDDAYLTDLECAESYCLCQNVVEVKLVVPANKTEYTLAECTIETAKCLNKNVVREADPHTNAAGEEILGIKDCAEWLKDQDHVCKFCKVNFINDKINHGNNLLTDRYNANCLDPKDYEHKSCTVCKQMWVKVVAVHNPATEVLHDWSNTVAGTYVAPTWTTDGSRTPICALCSTKGETVVIPAPDMFFDMSIDNIYDMKDEFGGNYTWNTDAAAYKKTAAMKVSKLANSSFVAVTIYATGSATNFTSINMSIPFDAEALQFAPGMTADKNETLVIDGKTFVVDYNGTGNSVELFIHVENAKDGAPQNAELTNRTALITLYFQVNPDFYDVAVKNTISEATSLQFGDISVLEYDAEKNTPKQLTAIVTDTQAPVAGYPEVNGGAYVITVYKLGDLNLNGTVTDFDAILVEEMAFANGYDAQADIDKDGDVDLVDFMYMKQYVIEAINYAELAAKVATDAE